MRDTSAQLRFAWYWNENSASPDYRCRIAHSRKTQKFRVCSYLTTEKPVVGYLVPGVGVPEPGPRPSQDPEHDKLGLVHAALCTTALPPAQKSHYQAFLDCHRDGVWPTDLEIAARAGCSCRKVTNNLKNGYGDRLGWMDKREILRRQDESVLRNTLALPVQKQPAAWKRLYRECRSLVPQLRAKAGRKLGWKKLSKSERLALHQKLRLKRMPRYRHLYVEAPSDQFTIWED